MQRNTKRDAINELASRQHGAINRRQLLRIGINPGFVASRCANGEWVQITRTVWVIAGSPDTIERVLWIAFLSRNRCFISGRSAAALHRFSGFLHPARPEITVPYTGDSRSRVARVTRSHFFATTRRTSFAGLHVASGPETVFVVAAWISPRRTARIVDELLMADPTVLTDLQEIYLRYQGHRMRGMATLRPIILEKTGDGYIPSESELEALAWEVFADSNLPEMQRQSPMPWAPGAGRVDLYVESWRLIIELDGRRWHTRTEDFETDRSRDNAATAAGFGVLRFTWEALVNRPDQCLSTVEAFGRRVNGQFARSSAHPSSIITS